MAINFLVEWEAKWDPPEGPKLLSRILEGIDERVFQSGFLDRFWKKVHRDIAKAVDNKFSTKPGWPPLSPKYKHKKEIMVKRGYKIRVGTFGRKICKFTEMGKLTGVMYLSATKKRYAHVFEVMDVPNFKKAKMKYAIDLSKIPYPKYFDKRRPFFYLTETEAQKVMKGLHYICWREMRKVISKGGP